MARFQQYGTVTEQAELTIQDGYYMLYEVHITVRQPDNSMWL
jgi:hypothetical protein